MANIIDISSLADHPIFVARGQKPFEPYVPPKVELEQKRITNLAWELVGIWNKQAWDHLQLCKIILMLGIAFVPQIPNNARAEELEADEAVMERAMDIAGGVKYPTAII